MKNIILSIFILGLMSCSPRMATQSNLTESQSYNVEFVSATRFSNNPKNNLSVVFLVTPKHKDAFPPVLSMGLKYFTEESKNEIYVNLQNQQGDGMIQTVLYGKNVDEKSPKIYSIVKDKLNFDDYEDMLLVVFEFNNKIKMDVEEMGIIYGLWEKKIKNARVEKRYEFKIENITEEY